MRSSTPENRGEQAACAVDVQMMVTVRHQTAMVMTHKGSMLRWNQL
ncbi:MAG: hypothetical protein K8J31_26515 [Anaerolineae bacterium]|nr:hypothetical protein [Anaerolineae bacterium]